MSIDWYNWISLIVRWFHIIVGIAWIGASFYFVWLDNNLESTEEGDDADGHLWSIHGGGFYHNRKYMVAPEHLSPNLHWFKWEAYFTWISGFILFVILYYFGAQIYLIDSQKYDLSSMQAIGISLSMLLLSWVCYDLMCKSALRKKPLIFAVILFIYLTGIAYLADKFFSDRAAYIQVGAIIGTLMAGNVFWVIIPNQKKVVSSMIAGKPVDPSLGAAAKLRSLHNNYLTLPVLFMMISTHYPITYSQPANWITLAAISLAGVSVRHYFNLRHTKKTKDPFIFLAMFFMLVAILVPASLSVSPDLEKVDPQVTIEPKVMSLIKKHCVSCHSANPTSDLFKTAPKALEFDSAASIKQNAMTIHQQVVEYESMPMGEIEMSDEERRVIDNWYKSLSKNPDD